jgi:M6 family metalloprotease-like protein
VGCVVWGPKTIGRRGSLLIRTGTFMDVCQPGQQWVPSPKGELRSQDSCLSAASSGIVANTCDGSGAQHWKPRLAPATSSLEDQYGFGEMRRRDGQTTQAVPLVRVYVNYQLMNTGVLTHPVQYYEDRILGSRDFAINAYLADVTSGQFRWADAGHFGPFNDTTHTSGCDTGVVLGEVLTTFMERSLDLATFDANRDGTVDHHELQFMVIGNCGHRVAGAARFVGCLDRLDSGPGGLRVCPGSVAEIEDQVVFATLVHESLHTLGAYDLYPLIAGVGTSLMGYTINVTVSEDPAENVNLTFMLDAWHRFQLGWNHPVIQPLVAGQISRGTVSLAGDRNWHSSLILGTPDNHLLFEQRDQTGYDANGCERGIVTWLVERTPPPAEKTHRITTPDATNRWLYCPYFDPSHGVVGYGLPDGRTLAVWATGTFGSLSMSWVVGGTLDITVIEHSSTSTTATITVEARDHETGMRFPGKVTVDGTQAGNTDQPFEYEHKLELRCQFGQCTSVYRNRQFAVTTPGHDTATFVRP